MKELKFLQQRLRPLTSYCYLEQKTYYHDHMTALNPRTTYFLDSEQPQVLPLVFFFKLLKAATKAITQISTLILILITLSMYEGKHLQISQEIHTHSISTPSKTWLRVILLYLRQNIKPYTLYELGLSWKFCRKTIYTSFDRLSLIFN